MEGDGQILENTGSVSPALGSIVLQDGVLNLGVVDMRHVQWGVLPASNDHQGFDCLRTEFVTEVNSLGELLTAAAGWGQPPIQLMLRGGLTKSGSPI